MIYIRISVSLWLCLNTAWCRLGCWLWSGYDLVGSLKLQVSFAEYSLFSRALWQKRPIILRSLLIVATPYKLLQCVAVTLHCVLVCYKVLQRVAVRCSALVGLTRPTSARLLNVLQYAAVCCNVFNHAVTCCSVLQCVCTFTSSASARVLQCVAVCCSVLQYILLCCNVFRCDVVRWNACA